MHIMRARIINPYCKAAQWAELNPTLAAAEIGIESDTGLYKVGDGKTAWNELPYYSGEGLQGFVQAYGYVPKTSPNSSHRGYLTRIYTGTPGKYVDRMFMFLNKTVNGQTACELIPISMFANIRDQAEITGQ